MLLDYFDFVVHVFAPETRTFYGLERLWGNAEPVDVTPMLAPARAAGADDRTGRAASAQPARRAC